MSVQIIFSILFFIAFITYVQVGIQLVPHRKKGSINPVVIAVSLAMAIWSLGFSIANSALDYEMALMWRRISAFGWSFIFALFLHFVLVILEKPGISKHSWFLGLLYLPAVVSAIIFAGHPGIAPGQYNLVYSQIGWFNQSVNNTLDWFFNVYYIAYTLVALVLLVFFGRHDASITKKTKGLMVVTVVITFMISTITDILLSIYFPGSVPQIGPLILLIPILSIYVAIRNQGLLADEFRDIQVVEGHILDEISHRQLYTNMATIYLYGAYGTFIAFYFIRGQALNSTLLISGSFILVALLVKVINTLPLLSNTKDLMIACITSLSFLLFQLFFLDTAGMTAWVTPVVLIYVSILINNRYVLIMNSIFALISVIFIGLRVPVAEVIINRGDHFIRLFMMILFILMANYIHHVFIKRLRENERQVRRQKLVTYISEDFAAINKQNYQEKYHHALKLFMDEFLIDHGYIYVFLEGRTVGRCLVDYDLKEPERKGTEEGSFFVSDFSWWLTQLEERGHLNIPDRSLLSEEAIESYPKVIEGDSRSLLMVPLMEDDHIVGFIGLESKAINGFWEEAAADIVGILARHYSDAISKLKSIEEIEYLAYYDVLTGLPNRTLFNNRLEKEIKLCKRTGKMFGVFFVDLDSFKAINDTLGHESGDELLKKVADHLRHSLRSHDTVSRFGGDEFLIMVTNIQEPEALTGIADKIVKTFEHPILIGGHEFFTTASVGISVYPNDGETTVSLIKNADMAMYVAKDMGKNRYHFSSSLLKDDVLKKMKLTNSLYRALERQELELYYQPQMSVTTKKIVGLEALLRWHHPEQGLVPPLDFIYLAEQTGLIIPIGEWILKTACTQNMMWQAMGLRPIRMAVNLSVEQFRHEQLVETVQNTLEETKMDPKYLELEITESIAMKGSNHMIDMLSQLKALGVTISIDDFGTEYSSLSRIKVMPIDRIKMDMNFVQSISQSSKDDAIVRIIIQLAKSLDLNVIAEGVETEPQLDFLANQACDEVQGYFYYKPMKAEEVERILLEEQMV